ncbi:MAG: glycoside hydrolase family 2, partial [Acidobacteriota bacterium]|nr:glycoside hydrolase family 2 [Acidobacteriota bacterium]
MLESSRRQFLLTATMTTAGILVPAPLRAAAMESQSPAGATVFSKRLDEGWEYRQGPLAGIWEAWRKEEADLWKAAVLPHCFNAMDACDPDRSYFRGQGWYRTRLALMNPFADGRTVLHFQGAGQTTTLWVGSTLIGTHQGGYDEFVFDITEASRQSKGAKGAVPITVLCDNSPDLNRVPSDLSDFCLYGGLYRHVNLTYLPAVALDTVHIMPTVAADGMAEVSVKARLFNPAVRDCSCTVEIAVLDAAGDVVHSASKTVPV